MNHNVAVETLDADEMRAEYDFSGGVRGKYAKEMKNHGYTIRIYEPDHTFTERVVLGEKIVVLDEDVWEVFPDSESVNKALRAIISVMPARPAAHSGQ